MEDSSGDLTTQFPILNTLVRMLDFNSVKVIGAFAANATLGVVAVAARWFPSFDAGSKTLLTIAQIGVAVVTIVYICVKIRNESRK